MNSKWSDNLRERMEAHEEPSPEGLWEDIEQIMIKERAIQPPSKQKRILLWGKRIGAVAAVVLAILFVGDYFLKKNPRETPIVVQQGQVPYQPENNLPARQDSEKSPVPEDRRDRTVSPDNNLLASATTVSKESPDKKEEGRLVDEAGENEALQKEEQSEDIPSSPEREKKPDDNRPVSNGGNLYGNNGQDLYADLPIGRRRNKPAKWETSVYASNISSGATKTYDGYLSFVPGEIPPEEDEEEPVLGDTPMGDILIGNKYREVYTDVKHRQPITMGFSLNYNFDERWGITSGLTYTILSSQLRGGSDSHYYTSEQTLHNIGIPLNIHYNVWKNRNVEIYVSGGGLVEKNVSGTLTTDYVVDNKRADTKNDDISIDQLQWSLNTSVGVQYNLSPKMGLYVEPGVSYYFKNGSTVETIYKEKPANLNLRFGLRFSLSE